MGGEPYQTLRPDDRAHLGCRKIVLADMDTVRVSEPRDIRAIVHDDAGPGGPRSGQRLLGQFQQRSSRP